MTPKRRRVVLQKPSKGACRTCRNRRVKCDETRPYCNTCTLSGRPCEGFPPGTASRILENSNQPLKPAFTSSGFDRHSPTHGSILYQLSPFDSSLTRAERGAFQYFIHETASPLQLIIPVKDWINYALQISSRVPAVYHAITAVGSVTNITRIFDHTLHRPEPPFTQVAALQQYSKATSALQRYIHGAVQSRTSVDPVLLCCVLFSIFETIQLSSSVALSHLRFGIAAFENSRDSNIQNGPNKMKNTFQEMTKDLLSIFHRINAESTDCGRPMLTAPQYGAVKIQRPAICVAAGFPNVQHAKQVLDKIISASNQVTNDLVKLAEHRLSSREPYISSRQSVQYCMACCASRAISLRPNSPLLVRKEELERAHSQWSYHVSHLEDYHTSRRLHLMRFQQFLSFFKLATCRDTREEQTERFQQRFDDILGLAGQYARECDPSPLPKEKEDLPIDISVVVKLDRRDIPLPSNTQNTFSLEHAILPVLFLICFKCRSVETRKRSLLLLDTIGRREGIYWSGELAVYAQALIDLEEQRAMRIKSCERESEVYPIPEEAKFTDVVIEGLGYHEIRVVCSRFRYEQDGEIEVVEHGGVGAPPLRLNPLKMLNQQVP